MKKTFSPWHLLPFASSFLLLLAYPKSDLGLLAFVALVPLLLLLWFHPVRRSVICTWLAGGVFFLMGLHWLLAMVEAGVERSVTILGILALSFYLSLYFLLFAFLSVHARQRYGKWFFALVPFFWVAQEYLRSFVLTGFAWFFLGHTQYRFLKMIQIADIFGAYGVSFVVACINSVIALIMVHLWQWRKGGGFSFSRRFMLLSTSSAVLLLTATLLYGQFRLTEETTRAGPRVLLVQGNIAQTLKFRQETELEILEKHLKLTLDYLGQSIDLIVWPETVAPGYPNVDGEVRAIFSSLARKMKSSVLVGGIAVAEETKADGFYNSAFFFRRTGAFSGRYDKIHLVPFGEYLPLRKLLPWVAARVPYRHDLLRGKKRVIFSLDGVKFSSIICYEDTDARLVRQFKKAGADFFVLITNDAWFGTTSELDQHLAITVFRAVETRSSFARCANTGISSIVEPTGKISRILRDGRGMDRAVAGALLGRVLLDERRSLYLRLGDSLGLAALFVAVALGVPWRRLLRNPAPGQGILPH